MHPEYDVCMHCRNDESTMNSYSRHPNHVQSDRHSFTDHHRQARVDLVVFSLHMLCCCFFISDNCRPHMGQVVLMF